jgi:hypothetical protein
MSASMQPGRTRRYAAVLKLCLQLRELRERALARCCQLLLVRCVLLRHCLPLQRGQLRVHFLRVAQPSTLGNLST